MKDHSGSIQETGQPQKLIASNHWRKGFCIQNLSANPMWLGDSDVNTSSGSFRIEPGQFFSVPRDMAVDYGSIHILGTQHNRFTCKEW